MPSQERELVDLLWNDDQADALGKLKDMLKVKAAMAVDASKQGVADRMFPHVPDEGNVEPDPEALENPTAELEEPSDETDNGTEQ